MVSREIPFLVLAFAAGFILAGVHFSGLWLTVKRLPTSKRPLMLATISHFVRLAITLGGFLLLVIGGHWPRLALGLAGFVLCRVILTHFWGTRLTEGKA